MEKKIDIKEFFVLLWVNLSVTVRNLIEFVKVAFNYYSSWSFVKADISLRLMYLFHNPYSISKRFLMKKGADDVYTYGETPLTTLEKIARECDISTKDRVFELGSGRGRGCFWLNTIVGCDVVGIEYVPEFVERANLIKRKLGMKGIEFELGDIFKVDLSKATVIYLYGTCFNEKEIRTLSEKFSKLPKGTKIITVSYPLSDYDDKSKFEMMKHFAVPFTWGDADVYLQIVK